MKSVCGPIFILGFPRSGTTGLASGLSCLDGFASYSKEGHFIYLFTEAILRIRDNRVNPNCIVREESAKAALFSSIAKAVDEAFINSLDADSLKWIDKTPDIQQVNAIPALIELFPEAWFFYIYRDPREAVRSNVATWPDILNGKELEVANRWVKCQEAWRKMRSHIPEEKRLEIFQPDLRDRPENVVDEIRRFLSLGTRDSEALAAFWKQNRVVNRPNHGEAAKSYDKLVLSKKIIKKVDEISAQEIQNWPKILE
ncbi:sulfotransferase [Ruegeria sp. HKCCD7255]|uniref:sulfotransferase family protein n=1 Tax=Ruegeria sp. HKCCD7255 TaxID=2683004 RepID=UPI001489055C|nr:sulfotransferase [Ruegeria sp. HKCCD7255]